MDIRNLYQLFLNSSGICTDTRLDCKNSLFFSLRGNNFNGNKFAEEALIKGASYAVIDDRSINHPNYIFVDDVLETLQKLSNFHRKSLYKTKIIALTGSNGKTTTKELIHCVLSTAYRTISTQGNLNNHIGVPLSLLKLKDKTEFAVIEMGANHKGEISFLSNLIEPDFGLITNFGKAHLEGFGDIDGVIKAKTELYQWLIDNKKPIFINYDDPVQKKYIDSKSITFGENLSAKYSFKQNKNEMVEFAFKTNVIQSKLIGSYNFNNLITSCSIGLHFKVDFQKIKNAIENYLPKNNRSELHYINGKKIILDAYNANPTSMMAAIESFMQASGTKAVIIGEMHELGNFSKKEHLRIINLLEEKKIQSFLVGDQFFQNKIISDNLFFYRNKKDLMNKFPLSKINAKNILIKGSRSVEMEKILESI